MKTIIFACIYISELNNRNFTLRKSLGLRRSQPCPYYNIGQVVIVEAQELFLKCKTDSSTKRCIHNAGRSQMAAALFNSTADFKKARAVSAGTHPVDQVHRNAIAVMKEIGIDISNEKPKKISIEMLKKGPYSCNHGMRRMVSHSS